MANPQALTTAEIQADDITATFHADHAAKEDAALIEEFERGLPQPPSGATMLGAPDMDAPAKPDFSDVGLMPHQEQPDLTPSLAARAVKDIVRGGVETPRAMVKGARDAAQAFLGATTDFAEWTVKNLNGGVLPQMAPTPQAYSEAKKLPDIEGPKSVTGSVVKSVTQFLVSLAAVKRLPGSGPFTRAAAEGGARGVAAEGFLAGTAGALGTDPSERRLADLLNEVPGLKAVVPDYLTSKPDDTSFDGRLKNFIEGSVLNFATDGLLLGLKKLRAMRHARAAAEELAAADDVAAAGRRHADAAGQADETLSGLGDPEHPDVLIEGPAPELSGQQRGAKKRFLSDKLDEVLDGPAGELSPEDVRRAAARESNLRQDVFINWSKLDTPEDIKRLVQAMADADKAGINEAQRGVRSWAQTKMSAGQKNAWAILEKRLKSNGGALNAEESLALRQLWITSAEKLKEVSVAAKNAPTPANLFAFRKMMAVHYLVQREAIGARTEIARALNSWRIPAGGGGVRLREIEAILADAGGADVSRELASRIASLSEKGMSSAVETAVEQGWFAKTQDAIAQMWINALLSNPTTHVANFASNASVLVQQILERKVAERISRALGTPGGAAPGEALAMYHGAIQGFRDAMRLGRLLPEDAAAALARGVKNETRVGALSAEAWGAVKGSMWGQALNGIDWMVNLPGWFLGKSDEFWKAISYRAELHAQALRQATEYVENGWIPAARMQEVMDDIVAHPPETIVVKAADVARYNTFTQKPASVLNVASSGVQQIPLGIGRMLVPFKNTPINILTYVSERSPFAPLVGAWRADVAAGGARADLALARISTGTFVMAATMDLAMNGYISGKGPAKTEERQLLQRAGWQPYSIRIVDRWFAYDRADPVGFTMGMAADMAEIANNLSGSPENERDYEEMVVGAILSVAKNVTSKTYMEGAANAIATLQEPEKRGLAFAEKLAGSFIPSGVAHIARQIDPYLREARNITDAVRRRIPALEIAGIQGSKGLSADLDLWGRPVDYRSPFTPMIGRPYDLVSPYHVKAYDPEPIDAELKELGYFPAMAERKFAVDKVRINLDRYPGAYQRLVALAGNELKMPIADNLGAKDFLNALVKGESQWSQIYALNRTPEDKARYIRGWIEKYRDAARDKVLDEFPAIRAEIQQKKVGSVLGLEVR